MNRAFSAPMRRKLVDQFVEHLGWTVNEAETFIERSDRKELAFAIAMLQLQIKYQCREIKEDGNERASFHRQWSRCYR